MVIKASNGTEYYLVEVIAFILCYLKEVLKKYLAQPLHGNDTMQLTTDDFDWVITVPAIWKSRGKLMMREAAYMVCMMIIIARIVLTSKIQSIVGASLVVTQWELKCTNKTTSKN